MEKQDNRIKKIYICREHCEKTDIIKKILIEFQDESYSYFELPSIHRVHLENFEQDNNLSLDDLNFYIKEIFDDKKKQQADFMDSQIIFVQPDDLELQQFVEHKMENAHIQDTIASEENRMLMGSIFSLLAASGLLIHNSLRFSISLVALNSLLSSVNFWKATRYNRKLKFFQIPNQILRKAKLSFSCFMLALNIGLNITNLNINFDSIQQSIKLSRYSDIIEKQENILINLDNPFSESTNLVTTTDAEVNLLMEAFGANPLLNEEDLNIALSLQRYLDDNPYLDMKSLYEVFASVGVIHFISKNGNTGGDYSGDFNIISVYDCLDKEKYERTLVHELVHSTGHLDNCMLNEGMTSLICAEYFTNFTVTNAYCDHVLMTKIFCEMVTPEKMLEAFSKKDMTIIQSEMLKINPNEEDYEKLLTAMQEYSVKFKEEENLSRFMIDNEEIIEKMIYLLIPYLKSDQIDLDTKTKIVHYIGELGKWQINGDKSYFNKEGIDPIITYKDH